MRTGRKWLARLIVASDLLVWCVILITEPTSLVNRTINQAGMSGQIAVFGLILIGCMAVVDVIVNDLMPPHFLLRCAIRHRHTVYMLICLGCLSMVFVTVKSYGFSVVLLHYGFLAVAALAIALLDIRDRLQHQNP